MDKDVNKKLNKERSGNIPTLYEGLKNYKIGCYESIKLINVNDRVENTLYDIVQLLRTPQLFQPHIDAVREIYQEELKATTKEDAVKLHKELNQYKALLPTFTTSGLFGDGRSDKSLEFFNGLWGIDIDHKDNKEFFANVDMSGLMTDKYTMVMFDSPNGMGKKVIIKADFDTDQWIDHSITKFFEKLTAYYKSIYGIAIDQTCKNISRVMYFSYDKDIFINENSMVFKSKLSDTDKIAITKKQEKAERAIISNESVVKFNKDNNCIVEQALDYIITSKVEFELDWEGWKNLCLMIIEIFDDPDIAWEHFNRFSQLSVKHDDKNTAKLFSGCWKSHAERDKSLKKFSLKSFFYLMSGYGFVVEKEIKDNLSICVTDIPEMIRDVFNLETIHLVEMNIYNEFTWFNGEFVNGDFMLNQTTNMINEKFHTRFTTNQVDQYLNDPRYIKKVDPFKDFLDKSDRSYIMEYKEHFDKMCENIHCETDSYDIKHKSNVFIRWMLGVLENVYGNTYFDEMLVMLGIQKAGKTKFMTEYFCKWFSINKLYTENFSFSSTDKDDLSMLANSIIGYDDEMDASTKKDLKEIKKVMSKREVNFRPAYGHRNVIKSRIMSFLSSTNEDKMLGDATGNRRFLILHLVGNAYTEVKAIDIMDKDIDFEKVWYYVYCLWLDGLKPDDIKIQDYTEEYRNISPDEFMLNDLFETCPVESDSIGMTYMDIKSYCEEFNYNFKLNGNMLTKYFKKMGINSRKIGKKQTRYWLCSKKKNSKRDLLDEDYRINSTSPRSLFKN